MKVSSFVVVSRTWELDQRALAGMFVLPSPEFGPGTVAAPFADTGTAEPPHAFYNDTLVSLGQVSF
jgi:hypothetical protein